ncbi:MAG: rhamnan synthesis protein F [Lachnospiraceae bacterium]|nr:rhamnan synthesis protein F [Lachnospiraceae bacterium]
MGNTGLTKRGIIFFFYDGQGIVDRYVPVLLSGMRECADDIYIVVNGELTESGRRTLEETTSFVWQRENRGFDVGAYLYALRKIGWDRISQYDELVLMNHTIMGPVCSVAAMFDKMSRKDIDFWGLSMHYGVPFDPYELTECGYIKPHLQSHFLAFRRSLLGQEDFRRYWEELPEITSYGESVAYHESALTDHFFKLGYRWACYTELEGMEDFADYPLLKAPVRLIKEAGCPFFKRRSFFHDYEDYLTETTGEEAVELLKYIKEETEYDTDMIWETILRSANQADIKKCLQLNYILDSDKSSVDPDITSRHRTALLYHFYYEDLLEECFHYASAMPPEADIYITTGSLEKKKLLEQKLSVLPNAVRVILVNNRGRDVSALLVGARDIVKQYEYVCFVHDKKVNYFKPLSQGSSWAYHCFENLLQSRPFVQNVIGLFEENPRLGFLTVPPPIHGKYYPTLCLEWANNYEHVVELADKLDLHVPMERGKEPIAAIGSMFWFKTAALKKLFDVEWGYEDFPEEPLADDGTISHAIERIHSFVAQDAGYYPAWLFSDKGAAIYMTNVTYMLRGFNEVFFRRLSGDSYTSVKSQLLNDYMGEIRQKKIQLNPALYYDTGTGYSEADLLHSKNEAGWPDLKVRFSLEAGMEKLHGIRFDPCERGLFILKDLRITAVYRDGKKRKIPKRQWNHNGKEDNGNILFLTPDPWIDIPWKKKENPVAVEIEGSVSASIEEF